MSTQSGRVSMPQRAILNVASVQLMQWLCTQDIEEIRRWSREQINMVDLIPPEFAIDQKALHIDGTLGGWAQRRLLLPALRDMGPAAWDELLHLMDDAAQAVIDTSPDPEQHESALYVQEIVGVFLAPGENHGSAWYYSQMQRLRDMIQQKLEASEEAT